MSDFPSGDHAGAAPASLTLDAGPRSSCLTQTLPSVSPDGRWLAYVSDETGINQVYVRPFPEARVA